jgi:hypothetical protein
VVSQTERVAMDSEHETREPYSFRGGNFCISDVCSELKKWSDKEILEFNTTTGSLRAWWIDDAAAAKSFHKSGSKPASR